MEPGLFTIHIGVKGIADNLDVGATSAGQAVKDGKNRYYMRADVGNKNTIAVDALPPIEFTEASVVMIEGTAWAKIGGAANATITQAVLDGYDSFVQFQQVGGSWTNTRRRKAGTYEITTGSGQQQTTEELVVEKDEYYWKLEGTKAYVYADISFFAADSNYNTHLNVTANEQADCKMDAAINANFDMTNAAGAALNVNVVAIPGATEQADFWGNLGFIVTAK